MKETWEAISSHILVLVLCTMICFVIWCGTNAPAKCGGSWVSTPLGDFDISDLGPGETRALCGGDLQIEVTRKKVED